MLEDYIITSPSEELGDQIRNKIDLKTKPPGSLGQIERLAIQIALAQNTLSPQSHPANLLLFAGDHGLVESGVSAWPSEVTGQMVMNFLAGGAAANVFARANDAEITIADAGVLSDLPDHPDLLRANIRKGTRNALNEDALHEDEVRAALKFGAELATKKIDEGAKIILIGEMGIGNTSSASLLAHAIAGHDLDSLIGPGAGLDDEGVKSKKRILHEVVARCPGPLTPIAALSAFGGLEIAAMAGAIIGSASKRAIVVIDGFIANAAALVALTARPDAKPYAVFAHASKEPGAKLILDGLGVSALLDLDLRLGEGSGGLLALPLLQAACAMVNEMASFEDAGVTNKDA